MHILIVEDEKKIADAVKRLLEEAKLTVTTVYTGMDALHAVEIHDYDAIVLDLKLPDIDGIEVCKQMRSLGVCAPILMVTSRRDTDSKVAGLDAGADDYLSKPFSFEELAARVRALLRREYSGKPTVLSVRGIVLDFTKYIVHKDGTPIMLTLREYKVLDYLMRHVNQVCTKIMLEEHIWGSRYEHESNIIEVTISRLRKKLEKVGETDFITTRHGFGYTIEDNSILR